MKIGIYSPSFPGFNSDGGVGTYTRDLGFALASLGWSVHILTPGSFPSASTDGTVSVHSTRKDHFRGVEKVLPGSGANYYVGSAMKRLVARYHLNLVEFSNWEGLGLWYAWRRPSPLVVRLSTSSTITNAIDTLTPTRAASWDERRERWLSGVANRLVTHSDAHRRTIASELAIEPSRISVVPLSVPTFPDFVRIAPQFEAPHVVYLGRLEKRKGVLDLIRSIPGVLGEIPDTKFTFIGVDRPHCPGKRTHAEYIADEIPSAIQGRITLAGRLPDPEVDRLLQTADLLVAPSIYESFGLVFLEAMRWGTPVIGTTAGGIPEIVQDGETGLLVPPGNIPKLTATIIAALRDEELRRRLGEAGRKRVESIFTVERMARQNADLYADVIDEWKFKNKIVARHSAESEAFGR